MNNKIDIVANHYNESPEIVRRFLNSIEMQEEIDFQDICVWICSDGLDKRMDMSVMEGYSFPIKYAATEHVGKCSVRNLLMDSTEGDYIMFCDIDDCFISKDGIRTILEVISQRKPNVIASDYLAESVVDGVIRTGIYNKDIIRVHGKVFKRSYLKERAIRYCDAVQVNADQYFTWQAFALTDNFVWVEKPFYCWKYNPNSCTREANGFNVKNYEPMLTAYSLLADNLIRRGRKDLYDRLISTNIAMMYVHTILDPDFQKKDENAERAYEAIYQYLSKHFGNYSTVPEQDRKRCFMAEAEFLHLKDAEKYFLEIGPWAEQIAIEQEKRTSEKELKYNVVEEIKAILADKGNEGKVLQILNGKIVAVNPSSLQ